MSFANSFFLFALLGAAVPVAIHLMTRDRVQHVTFSTLRFFAKGAKLVVRRKKFQEVILLLMRASLVALLALAFARPYFGTTAVDSRHEFSTARVIVLDVSGSMRRFGLAEALKKEARDAAGPLREGTDAGALITFADTPEVVVPFDGKIDAIPTTIDSLAPGYGGTNIAEALKRAGDLLRNVRAKQKKIILISDLPRNGWSYFQGDWKLPDDVKLDIHAVKPSDTSGTLGILELSAPNNLVLDKQPSSISVRIANFSNKPQDKVDVTLLLKGQRIETQQVNLRANGTVAVRFRHVFDTPGDNPGSITVGSDPANVVYFNARTIPRIPVLVINGRPSGNPQTDGAYFLNKALVPASDSPFAVTTLAPDQVTPKVVAASTVVILANVGAEPPPVVDALKALLDRGGGVLFLPGDQAKAESFNAAFGAIAPCKLRQVLQSRPANGETAEALTRINLNHPIFDVFALPHHGDLSLPKFSHYWETTDTQLATVLARFGDDRPAIIEREVGKGISMALVSAIDSNWNNFARQSVFLPWVHQTVRYLAVQTGQRTVYTSGERLPIPTGDTLKDPQGRSHPATPPFDAAEPGFYQLLNPAGETEITYAVNASLGEADPATISGDEIVAAIERAPGETVGGLDADTTPQSGGGKQSAGSWWILVWGIVALSFGELLLGNKTLRH